jgi:ribosomal protein S18 acetylase RimI-like enzyme
MQTRVAAPADVAAIQDLHLRCLPPAISDFTFLGPRVVKRFYGNAITRNLAATILACDGQATVGFVMVTSDVHALFNRALLATPWDAVRLVLAARPLGLLRAAYIKIRAGATQVPVVPELVYLAVDNRFRGRGYGAALMDAAERWFTEAGIGYYELNVHAENPAALGLYVSRGMVVKRSYVKGGVRMHTLSKALPPPDPGAGAAG